MSMDAKSSCFCLYYFFFFFFNDTATTEIYPLSLHDALPIRSFRSLAVLSANRHAHHVFWLRNLNGMEDLRLLVAHGVCVKRNGWLHGRQRKQLEEMIRNHVAQGPGRLVIAAALLDADRLSSRNLHAIDEVSVPQGLRDAVRETEDHEVLHGLFAQIVIDAVDLLFIENLLEVAVQLFCRSQISSERLFHDDASPFTVLFLRESGLAQLLHHGSEKLRRHRQVEEAVALRGVGFFRRCNLCLEPSVRRGILEISLHVIGSFEKPIPETAIDRLGCELFDVLGELRSKGFRGH